MASLEKVNALRQRYLDKVRAIEYATKVFDNDPSIDGESNSYYISRYEDQFEDGPIDNSSFEGVESSGSSSYTVHKSSSKGASLSIDNANGAYYPTGFGLSSEAIKKYKESAQKILPSVSFSTDSYTQNKGISLPAGNRREYIATFMKYIESCGGINKDKKGIYAKISRSEFEISDACAAECGTWLRVDMIYYLQELQKALSRELELEKLTFSSLYRLPTWDFENIYKKGLPKEWAPWNGHFIGVAADIVATGEKRAIIADAAYKMGFRSIGIGNNFVHLDLCKGVQISYYGVPVYNSPGSPGRESYR